jgi:hypothetical protein
MSVEKEVAMTEFTLDMSMMFAIHDALRRDLTRVGHLEESNDGWSLFRRLLHTHHTIEDDLLWPVVRDEVAGQTDDLALLDRMAEEHAAIEPRLEALDRSLVERAPTAAAHSDLETHLLQHLEHEEHDALPLVDRTLSEEQWMTFGQASAQAMGPDMPSYMPWLLEGVGDDEATHLLSVVPPPVRQVYADEWRPAFVARDRWATKSSVE